MGKTGRAGWEVQGGGTGSWVVDTLGRQWGCVSAVQSSDWRHDMGVAGMETDLGFSYFLLASLPRLPTILLPQVTG